MKKVKAVVYSTKEVYARFEPVLKDMGIQSFSAAEQPAVTLSPSTFDLALVEVNGPPDVENGGYCVNSDDSMPTILLFNGWSIFWEKYTEKQVCAYIYLNISDKELSARVKAVIDRIKPKAGCRIN